MERNKEKRKQLVSEYQERERKMGIYQIKNETNGKLFIGGSTNLEGLWNKETFILDLGSHMNKELQREWKQFGAEKFSFLILETIKFDHEVRYDYKDVLLAEGADAGNVVRSYKREIDRLKEKWIGELQPYGERGYHKKIDGG
ncbi:GIY-YIG nuclease family protein [Paenibacillus sp. 2TAB19]|uniref:GIY-YIG nuclease family protein n=1 Tax=Paenibacillus sp. 2TAB19 TaxID=3233003 RepID=UPI003F9C73EE